MGAGERSRQAFIELPFGATATFYSFYSMDARAGVAIRSDFRWQVSLHFNFLCHDPEIQTDPLRDFTIACAASVKIQMDLRESRRVESWAALAYPARRMGR